MLTFAILWIGLLIESELVDICGIKTYIIKSALNVVALYFEERGPLKMFQSSIYICSRQKIFVSNLLQKYEIVYYLLHSRLSPITFETCNLRFLNKNMLKLTEKSCGLYCKTLYGNTMAEMQVIDHKLQISELCTS